jgi:hypothetical protein
MKIIKLVIDSICHGEATRLPARKLINQKKKLRIAVAINSAHTALAKAREKLSQKKKRKTLYALNLN